MVLIFVMSIVCLAAFKIFFLSLVFINLPMMYVGVGGGGIYLKFVFDYLHTIKFTHFRCEG